jgi:hypothetical protein
MRGLRSRRVYATEKSPSRITLAEGTGVARVLLV